MRLFSIILILFTSNVYATPTDPNCVILVEVQPNSRALMSTIHKQLNTANYMVVRRKYSGRSTTTASFAARHLPSAITQCQRIQPESIHFIADQLGGLMLRFFLNDNPISNLGRVVMLGIDSELSNNIDASANSSDSYQSVDYDVGVITDSKQAPLFVTLLLSKQEEWLVVQTPVATPKIEILVTPENSATEHLFFTIIEQALHFIRNGYFIN